MTNEEETELIKLLYKSPNVYQLCKKIIEKHDNNMNVDIETNGELNIIKFLSNLSSVNVVFDIGANVGKYSQFLLQYLPKATIFAFDPVEENINELKKNTSGRINYITSAVSNVDGQSEFYIEQRKNSGHSSLYDMNTIGYVTESKKVIVKVQKLDSFVQSNNIQQIDFVKIDIEGNELNALKGAEHLFKKNKIKLVQFEFGHASRANRTLFLDFVEFFKMYGFDIYIIKTDCIEKVLYNPFFENKYDVANFLAFNEHDFPEMKNLIKSDI